MYGVYTTLRSGYQSNMTSRRSSMVSMQDYGFGVASRQHSINDTTG